MNLLQSEYLNIVLIAISSVILFLFAIESLSSQLQKVATEGFRKKISVFVKNRFSGALVGAVFTAFVQSSSAVTAIAISLVNLGVISFRSSLGIIFGSSIGTTITAQLALVSSTSIGAIILIIGFLLRFLGPKFKEISKSVFFLGFVLFALNIITTSIEPLKTNPAFVNLFSYLSNPLVSYTVSCLFTILVHSSSITSGLLVVLVAQGIIPVEIAIPVVLGANLGTGISTFLVSKDLNLFGKRAGYANVVFRVVGTLAFMLFVPSFISLLESLTSNPAQQVALGHLLFNLINSLVFLIFLTPFEKFIVKIVPGEEEEILFETKYIDMKKKKGLKGRLLDIKKEIAYSLENTQKIYKKALSMYYDPSPVTSIDIDKFETLNDYLDDEITAALLSLSEHQLDKKRAKETVTLVKVSNTIEQLGDLALDLENVFTKLHKRGISKDDVQIEQITEMFNKLMVLFDLIKEQVLSPKEKELVKVKEKEEEIYFVVNSAFNSHVQKLQEEGKYHGNTFVDSVSIIEASVSKLRDIRKLLLRHVRSS